MHHLPVSMTHNESSKVTFLSAIRGFHVYCDKYGSHMQEND